MRLLTEQGNRSRKACFARRNGTRRSRKTCPDDHDVTKFTHVASLENMPLDSPALPEHALRLVSDTRVNQHVIAPGLHTRIVR